MITSPTIQSTLSSHTMDPMLPFPARILAIRSEAPGISTYTLEFEDTELGARYSFKPGQFNMLYMPGIGEVAISISSDPATPSPLLHTIRIAGNVTQAIARLKVGNVIGMRGPYGSAWPVEVATGKDVIFVGGGIGLAPLRPAIYHIISNRSKYQKVQVLVGARTPADLLYPGEYDAWRAHDIEVLPTVDRADASWKERVGVVPLLFYSLRPDPKQTVLFTCGPEIMMRFVIYEARARRIPKEKIFISLERNMKCAAGFCGHCQYGPYFLCKEGPVFSYDKVEELLNVEDF
ncbi:MAG: FAD/NAD(P)-binding protein [Anaerolineales bacterium]|nr:FAD/NAD(P)-binding protein [Anaerolineales bacterium]